MYYIINIIITCPITACSYSLNFENHPRHHPYPQDFEYPLQIIRCSSVPVYGITYYAIHTYNVYNVRRSYIYLYIYQYINKCDLVIHYTLCYNILIIHRIEHSLIRGLQCIRRFSSVGYYVIIY